MLAVLSVLGLSLPVISHLLAGTGGTIPWLIDLAAHWQWGFLGLLLLSGGVAAWFDKRWLIALLAVPIPWLTASGSAATGDAAAGRFSVVSANVALDNADTAPLLQWVEGEPPDVIVLLEASDDYYAATETLAGYPFRERITRRGPFNIALLSRHPIIEATPVFDGDGVGRLMAVVRWQDTPVRIAAFHPVPPLSPHYHASRNRTLRGIALALEASGQPGLIAGDFNATPWSSAFSGLSALGLRRASGLSPTWPAKLGGVMGIPIDHVLVTGHWSARDYGVGPDIGSDHYPVRVDLVMPSAGGAEM